MIARNLEPARLRSFMRRDTQQTGRGCQRLLGLVLAMFALMAELLAAAQLAVPAAGRRSVAVEIASIGATPVRTSKSSAESPSGNGSRNVTGTRKPPERNAQVVYLTNFREQVEMRTAGTLPAYGVPYVLVRRENDKYWRVQQ